jgi:hypothetical protein
MSEAKLFRQYAEEALTASSKTKDEIGKRNLDDLASVWMRAAVASELVFAPASTMQRRDVDEAKPRTRS